MRTLRATRPPESSAARQPRCLPLGTLWLVPTLLLAVGCGSGRPDYDSLPPQTLSPFPAPGTPSDDPIADGLDLPSSEEVVSNLDLAERPPAQPEEEESSEGVADRAAADGSLIVIGGNEAEEEEGDIWERVRAASARERSRRESAEEPVVVITNKNLAEMAEGGNVTFVKPAPGTETAGTADDDDGLGPMAEMREQEIYWRERARDIRVRLKDAHDEVEVLEDEAAELRMRFYREDDPFTRDGRIKPAWDHTLELLDEARVEVDETQIELELFMEEGRRAGALPGWLREGAELIPPPPEKKEVREAEVGEPRVVDAPP